MARVEFASVMVSFFIHSTEDTNRLLSIVADRLGLELNELQSENIEGHSGNMIISVKAHLTGKRASYVASNIFEKLSTSARTLLMSELDKSVDEHDSLYLRMDRQSLGPKTYLSDEEPIRLKLKPKFRAGGRESMLDNYRELIR